MDYALRRRDANFFETFTRCLRIAYTYLDEVKCRAYPAGILFTLRQFEYYRATGHPVLKLVQDHPAFFNEEAGEVSFGMLSSVIGNSPGNGSVAADVKKMYQAIGAHRAMTVTAKARFGLSAKGKMHETTDIQGLGQLIRLEVHLRDVAKGMINNRGAVQVYDVDTTPVRVGKYFPGQEPGQPGNRVQGFGTVTENRVNRGAVTIGKQTLPCYLADRFPPDVMKLVVKLAKSHVSNTEHPMIARWAKLFPADRLRADNNGYPV
jgi:hypothetical protein